MNLLKTTALSIGLVAACFAGTFHALAQGSAFTYQGRLFDNGGPANGAYDLRFTLKDAVSGGGSIGVPVTIAPLAVTNGLFTAQLDFGNAAFTGAARWLEIAVRANGSVAAYTTLAPRQALTPAPYAMLAGTAASVPAASVAGTLSTSQLPANVARLDANETFTGQVNFAGGNLGVGTTTPYWPLHVVRNGTGSGYVAGFLQPNLADGNSDLIWIGRADDMYQCGSLTYLYNAVVPQNSSFSLGLFGNPYALNVLGNGNVGIGTTAPQYPLAFANTPGDKLSLWSSANGNSYGLGIQDYLLQIHTSLPQADIAFGSGSSTNFSEVMRIKGTGNVGIGTTTPSSTLTVAGVVESSSGGFKFPNGTILPTANVGGALRGSLPNPSIADGAVTSAKIADAAVGASELADSSVTTAKLVAGAVTDAKVTSVAWTKITGTPTSLPPNGAAGGDLTGTYPNPTAAVSSINASKLASDSASLAKVSGGKLTASSSSLNASVDLVTQSKVDLKTSAGALRVRLQDINGGGGVGVYSPGSAAVPISEASFVLGDPTRGQVSVNYGGAVKAQMYVNASHQGVITADVKSFRVPNPHQVRTDIWYASVEGPEAAAYVRGTARLIDGRATITFPAHFIAVSVLAGMTVHVTPLAAESKGLAVVEKSLSGVKVQELLGGNGNYDFDYEVKCVRQGHENWEVIRPSGQRKSALSALSASVETN